MTPEELYLANEKLIYHVLNRYFPKKRFDEDYEQLGRLGLWKACLRYDPTFGPFSTFACPCIANEIKMEIRKSLCPTRSNPDYIFISLDKSIGTDDDAVIADVIMGESDIGYLDLDGFLGCLTYRERSVIVGLIDGKKQVAIAKDMGVTHGYVSKLVGRIRKKWSAYI